MSTARLERLARALLVALALAFVVTLAAGSGSSTASGRVGGDYPAFYGAGTIVKDGDGRSLYDIEPGGAQDRSQQGLYGNENGFLYYVYPPPVALFFTPFALLPYRASYALATAVMVGGLWAALLLVRPMVGVARRSPLLCFVAAIAFYPMLRAVTSGQNTSITLLLLAALWRLEHELAGSPQESTAALRQTTGHARWRSSLALDALTGLALGLLLLKPQLGAIVAVLHLVRRRWRPVVVAATVGLVLWAVGAAVSGVGWLGGWWHVLRTYEHGDSVLNAHQSIAWFGAAESVLGVGSAAAEAVGYPLALLTLLLAAWVWWRVDDAGARYGVAAAAVLLASPHTVFYDAGLLVLPGLVLVDRAGSTRDRRIIVALWLLGLGNLVAKPIGITPVLALTAAALALTAARALTADPP